MRGCGGGVGCKGGGDGGVGGSYSRALNHMRS